MSSEKSLEKKIDLKISIIRLISLVMIISCHILQFLGMEAAFWLNIGVQIFFFISGFLYGKKDITNVSAFYKNKIIKILLPYTVCAIIVFIIEKVFIKISYGKIFLIGTFAGFQGFMGTLKTLSHTWFVSYILICYLITPVLERIFKNETNITKNLFIMILGIQLAYSYNVTSIIAPWLINYILGYVYSRYYNKEEKREKYFVSFLLAATFILLPFRIILQYNWGNIQFPTIILNNKDLIYGYSHVLLGCSLFIILYKLFGVIKNKKYNFILKASDKYSYFIYLTHQIFILEDFSLMSLTNSTTINILIIFMGSIISGVILYYIYELIIYLSKICYLNLKKINIIRILHKI